MQKHKSKFTDLEYIETFGNIQSCLRLKDLDEIEDGNHLLSFEMIGLFSFRSWTIPQTIKFFNEYLRRIGIKVDYVTIHPDKPDWGSYHEFPVKEDIECKWSDGTIGGYCTEYYSKGLEIGNIVNPLGTCVDVGFGLERLLMVLGEQKPDQTQILKETVEKLIRSGIEPSSKKQGYVLRKLIRRLIRLNITMNEEVFKNEFDRFQKQQLKFTRLYQKHKDKSSEWWWDTHGIILEDYLYV